MKEPLYYFVYRSNMSRKQMEQRFSRSISGRMAWLIDFDVVFGKPHPENNWGKINLIMFPGKVVTGVLYEISHEELQLLGTHEHGYEAIEVQVFVGHHDQLNALAFCSTYQHPYPPLSEYLDEIISGATGSALPKEYIELLHEKASDF